MSFSGCWCSMPTAQKGRDWSTLIFILIYGGWPDQIRATFTSVNDCHHNNRPRTNCKACTYHGPSSNGRLIITVPHPNVIARSTFNCFNRGLHQFNPSSWLYANSNFLRVTIADFGEYEYEFLDLSKMFHDGVSWPLELKSLDFDMLDGRLMS